MTSLKSLVPALYQFRFLEQRQKLTYTCSTTTIRTVNSLRFSEAMNGEKDIRQLANFPQDVWGDYFLTLASHAMADENEISEHEKMKHEVRKIVTAGIEAPSRNLELVNTIQRLGISYHFENEIKELLKKMKDNLDGYIKDNTNDLYKLALCFRLLRQQGYILPCETEFFSSFKDDDGNFKMSLDDEGLLSLYEASVMRTHREEILEEAFTFTTARLESIIKMKESTQVKQALKYPIQKTISRLQARFYISNYEDEPSHNKLLLNFSKLDYNILQKQHQIELNEISRWWKDLDVKKKFPFARDQIALCYFIIYGVYFEPEYAWGRKVVTKAVVVASIMDDIYDVHGTPEELELLTGAIDRWEPDSAAQLPEYLKNFYLVLLDVFKEIENEMAAQGKSYQARYAIEEMKRLAKGYHSQAKWNHQNYTPNFEEYMQVGFVTAACSFLSVFALVGMRDISARDTFEWVSKYPKIILAASTITRLLNDIRSHEMEQERGHSPSAIECYMEQYGVSTKQEVVDELYKRVSLAWKDINEEYLEQTPNLRPILLVAINCARLAHVLYTEGDGYTDPQVLKDFITSLFVDPIPY